MNDKKQISARVDTRVYDEFKNWCAKDGLLVERVIEAMCHHAATLTRAGRGGVGNGWHLLRSTWATREARRGTSLWELMRLGGWVVPQTVMRYVSLAGGEMKTPQAVARGV